MLYVQHSQGLHVLCIYIYKEAIILYRHIYERLREDIKTNTYPLGSKLPSVQQLCETYSASAITVRRALDILRDEGYVVRKPKVGTTVINTNPDKGIKPHQTLPTIAFLTTDFSDSFGTPVLMGALKEAQQHAHILLSKTSADDHTEDAEISSAINAGANGLILMPSSSTFIPKAILDLISRGFPVTIVDRVFQGIPVATVSSDNINAAKQATDYLFQLGHKNVAFISSASPMSTNTLRHDGWAMAHAINNNVLDDALSFTNIQSTIPDASTAQEENDITRLMNFMNAHHSITACLVSEYNIALLVREALHRLGSSIPNDVSVICFDHANYTFDRDLFKFTHIAQNQKEIGKQAVNLTLQQISQGPSTQQLLIPATLVEGDSTATIAHR